jgi:NAD(P)-dependent dehydrogenase (short-subunit alcohol dehydrogenase family)
VSGVTSECTIADVLRGVDLTGRTAVITGASSGLGLETARALQSVGCEVVAAVRDFDKTRAALDGAAVVALDLSDLDSVRSAAAAVARGYPRVDLLINNAGVMAPPLMRTAQGFELQLGTNHLGHFVFTHALLANLGEGSRIVNLSSRGHLVSGIRWEDPNFHDESAYQKWVAYGQSKSANVLFTVELERRLAPHGIHAFAVHPGVVVTELARHVTKDDMARWGTLSPTDASHGAATTVWAATSRELDGLGGLYLEDWRIGGPAEASAPGGYAAHAVDPEQAARLWEWSEQQTDIAPGR